jgi:peroxiredoxin
MLSRSAWARSRHTPKAVTGHPAWRWAQRLVWVAFLAFVGVRIWPQLAAAAGVASSNGAVPRFTLTTLDGAPVTSESLAGKVVLLNFWATWCPPCRVEMPGFQRAYDRFRDDGFVVLGVAMDAGGAEGVRRFLAERGITYPVAMATPAAVRDFGGVRLLPTSYLIDRGGRIRNEVSGLFTSVALEQAIARLLREPVPPVSQQGTR